MPTQPFNRGVRIGQLARPLQLQARQTSTDAEGRPQENWVTIAPLWAQVQPLTASEHLLAAQAGLTVSHEITVYWQPTLGNAPLAGGVQGGHDLRLMEGKRVYEIISVLPVQDGRRFLRMLCTELQPV